MATLFCTIVRVQSLYAGTGLQPLAARALKNSLEKKISQTLNVFYIGIFAYVYHKKKGKCRWIYHTLSVWVFFLFGCFGKRHRHVVFLVELQNVSFNFLILEETNVYKIITIFIYRISFDKQISLSLSLFKFKYYYILYLYYIPCFGNALNFVWCTDGPGWKFPSLSNLVTLKTPEVMVRSPAR